MKTKGYGQDELDRMTLSEFLFTLRENYLIDLNSSEEGREALKNYKQLHNKKMDYDSIKNISKGYKAV